MTNRREADSSVVGTTDERRVLDWQRRDGDGETVYEIEYSEPLSEPVIRSPPWFGPTSGGTVPNGEQVVWLPDGERIPAVEVALEVEGTTLRVRRREPSVWTRVRRWIPFCR